MAGKYLSGSGLGYLWTKMKSTFLLTSEEMASFSMVNKKFATFDDTVPHGCGNSLTPTTRKLIPLQVSPDFNGSTGCYIYESYVLSSRRAHYATYQLDSLGKLYTVPASGSPTLVKSLSHISSDGTWSSTSGFYVLQDEVHGNWWLSNSNATIDKAALGIPTAAPVSGGDDPIVTPPESAAIYIVGQSLDSSQINSSVQTWWNSTDATVFIKIVYDDTLDWTDFTFTSAVSVGGTRVCSPVSDGYLSYQYTLTRTSSSGISINYSLVSHG